MSPELTAAYRHVDKMALQPDGNDPYPYWYGWALREAFLAGFHYANNTNETKGENHGQQTPPTPPSL